MKSGFLLVDKPKGITSRKVCNQISFCLGEKKIGHIGTLDPFATGLLIVEVNKANKAGTFLEKSNKTYIATLKLGVKTSTGDNTGEVIKTMKVETYSKDTIEEALNSFKGKSKQIPPMTSAIHYDGVKLYKLAHQGKEVEREAREIEVFDIELISYNQDELVFKTTVSSGTYIRVLAEDIAVKLNTIGHLNDLRRTNIGSFSVDNAVKIEDVNFDKLISIYDALKNECFVYKVTNSRALDIANGKELFINVQSNHNLLMVVDQINNPIAMYVRTKENVFEHKRGLF